MERYLHQHESFVRHALESPSDDLSLTELQTFHQKQIGYMQHERLVHLVVTMFTLTFFLLCLGFLLAHPSWPAILLVLVLLVLSAAYLLHYYRLENGVQRWYHLSNALDLRLGLTSARYDRALRRRGAA